MTKLLWLIFPLLAACDTQEQQSLGQWVFAYENGTPIAPIQSSIIEETSTYYVMPIGEDEYFYGEITTVEDQNILDFFLTPRGLAVMYYELPGCLGDTPIGLVSIPIS